VLTFAGAVVVLAPVPAAIAIVALVLVRLVTRRFDWAARVGVFGFPIVQAFFEARAHVAATGALMTFIGLRFFTAARQSSTREVATRPACHGLTSSKEVLDTDGPANSAPGEASTA
jgi:hypothetical protein